MGGRKTAGLVLCLLPGRGDKAGGGCDLGAVRQGTVLCLTDCIGSVMGDIIDRLGYLMTDGASSYSNSYIGVSCFEIA